MGLLDKLTGKEARLKREAEQAAKKEAADKKRAENKAKREAKKAAQSTGNPSKEEATARGEPYVTVLSMDLDPTDMSQGAFELDWNDKFIANLVRAGYKMKDTDTDADLVDRWFQNVCRNVVLETWEQEQAMNPQRDRIVKTRDLGDGLSEVS
jgi:hypothetical protein